MYCPRCAKQNVAGAKFCRDCGTDLETVALALDGKLVPLNQLSPGSDDKSPVWDAPNKGWEDKYNNPQTTEDWLRKQGAGANFIARGATLLATTIIAGVVTLMLFGVSVVPLIIWASIFGFMGCWGVAYVAEGFGAIMQSRNMLRHGDPTAVEPDADSPSPMFSGNGELRRFPVVTIDSEAPPRSSITEDTTARLNKQHRHG
jgi:hypothetical protein